MKIVIVSRFSLDKGYFHLPFHLHEGWEKCNKVMEESYSLCIFLRANWLLWMLSLLPIGGCLDPYYRAEQGCARNQLQNIGANPKSIWMHDSFHTNEPFRPKLGLLYRRKPWIFLQGFGIKSPLPHHIRSKENSVLHCHEMVFEEHEADWMGSWFSLQNGLPPLHLRIPGEFKGCNAG